MAREVIIETANRIALRQKRIDELKEIDTIEAFYEVLQLEEEATKEWESAANRFEYLKRIN